VLSLFGVLNLLNSPFSKIKTINDLIHHFRLYGYHITEKFLKIQEKSISFHISEDLDEKILVCFLPSNDSSTIQDIGFELLDKLVDIIYFVLVDDHQINFQRVTKNRTTIDIDKSYIRYEVNQDPADFVKKIWYGLLFKEKLFFEKLFVPDPQNGDMSRILLEEITNQACFACGQNLKPNMTNKVALIPEIHVIMHDKDQKEYLCETCKADLKGTLKTISLNYMEESFQHFSHSLSEQAKFLYPQWFKVLRNESIDLKYIVIDGSNVAFDEKNAHKKPSLHNILAAIEKVKEIGYKPIIYVNGSLKYSIDYPQKLVNLIDLGLIKQGPPNVSDDVFIIKTAIQFQADILSNDKFFDHLDVLEHFNGKIHRYKLIHGIIVLGTAIERQHIFDNLEAHKKFEEKSVLDVKEAKAQLREKKFELAVKREQQAEEVKKAQTVDEFETDSLQCTECNYIAKIRQELSQHLKLQHALSLCVIEPCTRTLKTEDGLEQHLAVVHNIYKCLQCDLVIDDQEDFLKHRKIHR